MLIHVEVQMSDDGKFPWRMYVYNYRLFDKYNVEVASFAVLGDDNPRWRPHSFGYRRWGSEVGFRFPIVKLLDYAERRAELEASSNPFATVVLAHLDTQIPATTRTNGKTENSDLSGASRTRMGGETSTPALPRDRLDDGSSGTAGRQILGSTQAV